MAPKKSSVSDLLKANKSGSGKGGGSKVPPGGADPLHDAVYHAYIASKDAEAAFRGLEAELLERVHALYVQNGKSGRFSKSYNMPGLETPGVQVSYKDQFIALTEESQESLRRQLGDDFDRSFKEKRELQLLDTSDANIEFLIKTLGEDKFFQMFNVKVSVVPQDDMDRNQFALSDSARAELKQYKATVKLAK